MKSIQRRVLTTGVAAAFLAIAPGAEAVDSYPNRPVRLIVPFPPGGPTDNVGRVIGQRLGRLWGQPVVVENKPGASGAIGTQQVANAAADGYTLLLALGATNGSAEVLNPKVVSYRTLRDFAPIGFIGVTPTVVVVGEGVPARDMKEFAALVRATPGKYTYANSAQGSAPHFAFEMLKIVAGLDVREIPFNGAAPAIAAVGGRHVDAYMGSVFSVTSLLQTGRAHVIGVASEERIESMPEIATLTEQGFPVVWNTWYGVLAPAGVAEGILDRLNRDLNTVLKGDGMKEAMSRMGLILRPGERAQMSEAVAAEIENATRVARQAGMIKE